MTRNAALLSLIAVMSLSGCMGSNGINFGDDKSVWAKDGECDDPRFTGVGTDEVLLPEDRAHDATDCRALYEAGKVTVR